jgi:hypothetical protein
MRQQRNLRGRLGAMVVVAVSVGAASMGCVFNPGGAAGAPGTGGRGSIPGIGGGIGPAVACVGLQCRQSTCSKGDCVQAACSGGALTRLTGKVYDPAGKVPLYNISVYVPNKPLADYADGPSCDSCATMLSGEPVVQATTDASGSFVLGDATGDVPSGDDIPLVIQVGKWRRQITIPHVDACADTALTDPNLVRLPRNQQEGHLPKIALTTGGADALECLLRKIGVDDAEFTTTDGPGRINLFNGVGGTKSFDAAHGGASFTQVDPWWDSLANLRHYDMILHSCEGTESPTNKSTAARQALQDYANAGGRVFASHWHNYWFEHGPAPWPGVAVFNHQADLNDITATIDTSFDKGKALAQWLVNVNASTTLGQLPLQGAQHTIDRVGTGQRWIYSSGPQSVQYLSANTPMGSQLVCGRVVLSDIHVSTGAGGANDDDSDPAKPFPTGCVTTDLSPQEKTLEFMLFDLSACVVPDVG